MARIAKSKDTANWRKGKDIAVGNIISVWVHGAQTFQAVVSIAKVPYMSVTNYQFTTTEGRTVTAAGGEFVEGQY
jgi:hypothetical protein